MDSISGKKDIVLWTADLHLLVYFDSASPFAKDIKHVNGPSDWAIPDFFSGVKLIPSRLMWCGG
jgi:hypothetical protein